MSPNRRLRRAFPIFLLLAALFLAAVPAQAQPATPSFRAVTVFGENGIGRAWAFLMSLWQRGARKEGTSIDPNGGKSDEGVTIDPDGATDDEGMSIDPDGQP